MNKKKKLTSCKINFNLSPISQAGTVRVGRAENLPIPVEGRSISSSWVKVEIFERFFNAGLDDVLRVLDHKSRPLDGEISSFHGPKKMESWEELDCRECAITGVKKRDTFGALTRKKQEYRQPSVKCFNDSWLQEHISDSNGPETFDCTKRPQTEGRKEKEKKVAVNVNNRWGNPENVL